MVYCGVDPGLSGAIAVLDGNLVEFHDTPTVSIKVGKSLKNQMDPGACSLLISAIAQEHRDNVMVIIEKVAPMPSFNRSAEGVAEATRTMGATSAFNFGMGFGMWIGICAASLIPYQLVHPATWKRRIMADMDKGKEAGRIKAMQLYPHTAERLKLKKHHGRADALLLAHFGKLTYSLQMIEAPVAEVEQEELAF